MSIPSSRPGPLAALLLLSLSSASTRGQAAEETTELVVYVSSRTGDDTTGDGSEQAAWRSLSKALESDALRRADRVLLRVDLGRYDAESGERFPLRLPAGIRVRGLTADLTRIVAEEEELAVIVEGEADLGDLSVLGATTGIRIPAHAEVRLQDVTLQGVELGVERTRPAPGRAVGSLSLRSCRFVSLPTGLRVEGGGAVRLEDCAFRGGKVGLEWLDLGSEADEGPEEPRIPDHAALALVRTSFEDCGEAGLWRRCSSPDVPPPRSRLRIDDGDFRRCKVGLRCDAPTGSSPMEVSRCRFFENSIFGVRATGGEPLQGAITQIRDSEFRWNGIGIQIITPRIPHQLERLRLIDNLGAGLSLGCFGDRPATVQLHASLVADNGAAGVLSLSDGHHLTLALDHCTVVANHGAGLENASKRSGTAAWSVRHSIVAGNDRAEVLGLNPEAFTRCWLGRRPAGEEWAPVSWIGDPGFADAAGRDWSLHEDSPARDGAEHPAGERAPERRDALGRGPDLGAIQSRSD